MIILFVDATVFADVGYFVCGGTLLGSYRHRGLIPCNCDVDFCVDARDRAALRRALERLLTADDNRRQRLVEWIVDRPADDEDDGDVAEWRMWSWSPHRPNISGQIACSSTASKVAGVVGGGCASSTRRTANSSSATCSRSCRR